MNVTITPNNSMKVLSKREINHLLNSDSSLKQIFKNCSLAILNCGSDTSDGIELCERYPDFDISIIPQEFGIKLDITNAPSSAFVDGKMIESIKQNIFSALRDIIYSNTDNKTDEFTSSDITNEVFNTLRNANVLKVNSDVNLCVCWGGHTISDVEYQYSKKVGYHLGLRGLNVSTGSGAGIMKSTIKGASIGHAKQRISNGLYLGVSEPGIISTESPNQIINELIIMPTIERRLEAFIRTGHGIIVFPGGAGTLEEILFALGILLHPNNKDIPFPLIFAGDESSKEYFEQIDNFIRATLGKKARHLYEIIIGQPELVAQRMAAGLKEVKEFRKTRDAYYFNWLLHIDNDFQQPFIPTHESMLKLNLFKDQPINELAANLRRAFSGIVAGNVKSEGVKQIEEHGNFELYGDVEIMQLLDALLSSFVAQNRMKLRGNTYIPCYKIINI
jgi:predicted Rossmann-fold nucleotide-binding protein